MPKPITAIVLSLLFTGLVTTVFASVNKLSGTLLAAGDVSTLLAQKPQISADGHYVVFLADKDADEVIDLYSVDSHGSEPIKLNPAPAAGGDVAWFLISADSRRVIYLADQDLNDSNELYSVPITASTAPTKLNLPMNAGADVSSFLISPDGQRAVYHACPTGQECGVFSVPVTGPAGASLRISPDRANSGASNGPAYYALQISPDGARVVFAGSRDSGSPLAIYSAPLLGPNTEAVTLSIGSRFNSLYPNYVSYQISPDSRRVVYLADAGTSGMAEVYSVPIAGPASASVKLNPGLSGDSDVKDIFQISPDSQWVAFAVSSSTAEEKGLYRAALAGPAGAGVRLAPEATTLLFSPDSGRIVFRDNLAYSIAVTGIYGEAVALSAGAATPLLINAQSAWVIYAAEVLYRVPVAGPAGASVPLSAIFLNSPINLREQVGLSPDDTRLLYQSKASAEVGAPTELYSVPLTGDLTQTVKVNAALVTGGNVATGFRLSPDSRQVVYIADQDQDEVFELYASDATTTFVITPTTGTHGSLAPATPQTVRLGDSLTYTIMPDPGYHVVDVGVDGVSRGALGSYTFTGVTATHTITAAFAIDTHTLTVATAGRGSGVITPAAGAYSYAYGTVIAVTAVADEGSAFAGWGGDCSGLELCTVTLTNDRSVIAQFDRFWLHLPLIQR